MEQGLGNLSLACGVKPDGHFAFVVLANGQTVMEFILTKEETRQIADAINRAVTGLVLPDPKIQL